MKKLFSFLLAIVVFPSFANAQWVSPNNGSFYTFPELASITNGVVTDEGEGKFNINADLTISENDALIIDNQVTRIDIPGGSLITFQGSLSCSNNERVGIYGTMTQHFGIRLDNAKECIFKNLYLSDGGGIKIIESTATFMNVKFVYFTQDYCSSVIDIFNSNPTIRRCYFLLNDGPAISSPANGQSSPKIRECQFDSNSNNSTNPQINLGPGGLDTILITNNEIDGTYATSHVGGISIADLMGYGSTKVRLEENIIKGCRYGYNQQGQTISSLIIGNQFLNNNQETDPMNGGSGISIYGTSTNCKAVLRNNTITGNLWGITAIYLHDIDMGTEDEWGRNVIYNNGNGGVIYDLYNNSTCDLMAIGNNWNTVNVEEIENHIVHQADNPSYGLVTYIPYVGYQQVDEYMFDPLQLNDSEVTVYSISGQKVNPQSLRSGTYIVEIKHGYEKTYKKIIVK